MTLPHSPNDNMKKLKIDYFMTDVLACFLAALFFARFGTEPNSSSTGLTLISSYLLSVYLFVIALILLVRLFIANLNRHESESLDKVERFQSKIIAPSILSASIAVAFVELVYILGNIFQGTMILDKSLVAIFTFAFVVVFIIFYFVVDLMRLKWNRKLLALRLRISGIMLVAFSIVNLFIMVTTNQVSTFLRDSIIFLIIALICLLTGWFLEANKDNQPVKVL